MKKRYAFLFVFFLIGFILLMICNRKQDADKIIKSERVVDSSISPKDSNTLYFPSSSSKLNSTDYLNKFNNKWYSRVLYTLNEPVIFQSNDSLEVFRFIWLRTFHNPICIRVNNYNSKRILTLKISGGAGGFDEGKMILDTSFYISQKEWDIFKSKVTEINFWNLRQTELVEGKDGAEWILEAKNRNVYHFVDRWSPNQTRYQGFRSCCEYLISLTKFEIKSIEIY